MEREEMEAELFAFWKSGDPVKNPERVDRILAAFDALRVDKEDAVAAWGALAKKVDALREERDALAEKMVFLRSQCPEERSDDAPGFSQSEAYFWKNRAEKDHSRLARADALAEAVEKTRNLWDNSFVFENKGEWHKALVEALAAYRSKV